MLANETPRNKDTQEWKNIRNNVPQAKIEYEGK